jgi:hypothetical protein
MREILTEIEINASAEKVWSVLSDFERFPEWNPFVIKVEGKPLKGETLKIDVQLPDSLKLKFTPEVLVAEPNKELRWVGTMPLGMFSGEHFYKIEAIDEKRSRFIHGEYFKGWFVPVIFALAGKQTEKGYLLMNEAIKKRVESI